MKYRITLQSLDDNNRIMKTSQYEMDERVYHLSNMSSTDMMSIVATQIVREFQNFTEPIGIIGITGHPGTSGVDGTLEKRKKKLDINYKLG